MARQMHIPTKEELERDKPIVLKLFQDGIPRRRMDADYGFTMGYTKRIRKELIEEGLITEEEIKAAYSKYMAEHPAAQGLDGSKKRQKSNTEKADARHARSLAKKERVFELTKQKMTIVEIANEMQVSDTFVTRAQKELIGEGRLDENEIIRTPHGKMSVKIDKSNPEYVAKKEAVIKYLKLGWKSGAIRKHLDITPFYMNLFTRDIREQKILTPEEIEKARQEKRERDIKELEELINEGYSVENFRELHSEFSYNETTPLVKELIEQGKFTREQIDKNRRNAARKTLNCGVQMSPDEQLEFVVDKVRKGYGPQEILKSDKTKSLTMYKVLYLKRKAIALGIISQEEADQAMEKRQTKKLGKKHGKAIDKIIEYTKLGYNLQEIAEKIGFSYTTVTSKKSEYAKINGWFSKEELKEFRRQREIRELAENPELALKRQEELARREQARKDREEQKRLQRKKEVEERKQQRQQERQKEKEVKINQLIEYTMLGYNLVEISKIMHFSLIYISSLKREYKEKNGWFSEKELKAFAANRKKREAVEAKRLAKQKEEEEKKALRLERQKKRREQEEEKDQQRHQRMILSRYKLQYKSVRKEALIEDQLQFEEEDIEQASIQNRKEYLRLQRMLEELGVNLPQTEVDIALRFLENNNRLLSRDEIKFLIRYASQHGNWNLVEDMVINLMHISDDTKYHEPLVNYRVWVRKMKLLPRIQKMKEQGMNNSQIADEVGISSAEVYKLLHNEITFETAFPEEH